MSVTAHICDWCDRLHDPARNHPCPCQAPPATRLQIQRRHREAVELAHVTTVLRRTGRKVA